MELSLTLYSLFFLLLCACVSSFGVATYLASKVQACLYAVLCLAFSALDYFIIIVGDYLETVRIGIDEEALDFALSFGSCVSSTGFAFSLWLITLRYFNENRVLLIFTPPALVFTAMTLLSLGPFDSNADWFAFYTCRQIFLLFIAGYIIFRFSSLPEGTWRRHLSKYLSTIILFAAFAFAMIAEDAFRILVGSYFLVIGDNSTAYLLSERSFTNDLFIAFLSILFIKRFLVRLRTGAALVKAGTRKNTAEETPTVVPRFSDKFGITNREGEVLCLLAAGKTNREIADELNVSVGTVKAHVHNVFKKTDTASRKELKDLFWQL